MGFLSQQPLWLLFLSASPALAAFETFSFAGNGGNSSAGRFCGDMQYQCRAPNMCSQDTVTLKWYCCAPGTDDVCWNGRTTCSGADTETPSDQQIGCSYEKVKYCCLKDLEECTKRTKQINICWSTAENKVRPLNGTRLNATYSSLSSADPSATRFSIDQVALMAMTGPDPSDLPQSTSAPIPSSGSATATASTTPTSSSDPAPSNDSSDGLGGGAIGGIVGGVVGGLALLGALAFFFWRRRRNSNANTPKTAELGAPVGDPYQGYQYQQGYHQQPQQPYSPQPAMAQPYVYEVGAHEAPALDKYRHQEPVEAPTNTGPVEMDTNYYQQQQNGPNK